MCYYDEATGKVRTMIKQLVIHSIESSIPPEHLQVLIWHDGWVVDRGQRYGNVYRLADYSEDQLHDVTHWAEIPTTT